MINFSSKAIRVFIYFAYFIGSLGFAIYFFSFNGGSCFVISFFNFMRKVDSSGFLIFAGIAAGIYLKIYEHLFYRSFAFVTGFAFAVAQGASKAMNEVETSVNYCQDPSTAVLVAFVVMFICGIGFVLFSFLAMMVQESEQKLENNAERRSKNRPSNSDEIIVTPSLSSKSADARPAHAPSGLAQDLRLSRSRVRRSRVGR